MLKYAPHNLGFVYSKNLLVVGVRLSKLNSGVMFLNIRVVAVHKRLQKLASPNSSRTGISYQVPEYLVLFLTLLKTQGELLICDLSR